MILVCVCVCLCAELCKIQLKIFSKDFNAVLSHDFNTVL